MIFVALADPSLKAGLIAKFKTARIRYTDYTHRGQLPPRLYTVRKILAILEAPETLASRILADHRAFRRAVYKYGRRLVSFQHQTQLVINFHPNSVLPRNHPAVRREKPLRCSADWKPKHVTAMLAPYWKDYRFRREITQIMQQLPALLDRRDASYFKIDWDSLPADAPVQGDPLDHMDELVDPLDAICASQPLHEEPAVDPQPEDLDPFQRLFGGLATPTGIVTTEWDTEGLQPPPEASPVPRPDADSELTN